MRIVGISDLVADIYYDEKLNVIGVFGGISACNIICNLQYFGFDTFIYGVCGNDYLGKICIDSLNDCKVKNDILVLDNIKTKAYQIRKVKENNRDVFRSIKYCPICGKSTWYERSYIDEKRILKKVKKTDILLFDNLKNQYFIDNTNNIKLLDLGTNDEFNGLDKEEIIQKLTNKFKIINLNERVEKYLIKVLKCQDTIELAKIINTNLLIVTRGIKGNDFIYQDNKYTFPVTVIVDEVDDSGAGDAFFATIIKNWLNNEMKFDANLFSKWVDDTKPLVAKVLGLIGSRSFIYPMYQVNKKNLCNNYDYKIYIPSGNPTALVMGKELDPIKRKQINDEIMNKYDFVEQVGFINLKKYELMMAGGEFCGNATRSAVSYYLNNQPGSIKIKVSGVRNKLNAGIDQDNNVWVDMPIIKGIYEKSIKIIDNKSAIIKMYGITHVVIESGDINQKYDKEELKEYAYRILEKEKLLNNEAAGVIFVNRKNNNIEIYPVVYVSKIKTLFYETACGSGTTAVAIYESKNRQADIDIDVLQPSGEIINVKSIADKKKISNVRISGKVKEYKE